MKNKLTKVKKLISNKYFKLLVSIVIISYFLFTIDTRKIAEIFKSFSLISLSVILILSILRNLIGSIRFKYILDKRIIPIFEIVKQYFIASFYNNMLPTVIGGDAVRMYYLTKFNIKTEESIGLITFERIIGLYTEILLAFICCHFWSTPKSIVVVLYSLFGISTFFLMFIGRIVKKMHNYQFNKLYTFLLSIVSCLHVKPMIMFRAICLSLLFQIISVCITIYIAVVLGMKVDMMVFFTFLPLIWIFTMIPISFGGVGLREVSFVYLFDLVGYSTESSVAISLGTYASLLMSGVIGAIMLFFSNQMKRIHGAKLDERVSIK